LSILIKSIHCFQASYLQISLMDFTPPYIVITITLTYILLALTITHLELWHSKLTFKYFNQLYLLLLAWFGFQLHFIQHFIFYALRSDQCIISILLSHFDDRYSEPLTQWPSSKYGCLDRRGNPYSDYQCSLLLLFLACKYVKREW